MFNPEIEIYELTDIVTESQTSVSTEKLSNAGADVNVGFSDWF